MTPFDEVVLEMVMPRVQAWERLHDPHYTCHLTMGEYYDLLIEAGYSDDVAQKAAGKRGWDRLSAGAMM